jgi:hypothetical protein
VSCGTQPESAVFLCCQIDCREQADPRARVEEDAAPALIDPGKPWQKSTDESSSLGYLTSFEFKAAGGADRDGGRSPAGPPRAAQNQAGQLDAVTAAALA